MLGPRKTSLSLPLIHYLPFQSGTFDVVLFANCYVVFHFLMFFFYQLCKSKIHSDKFG